MTTWSDLLRPGGATDYFARGGTTMPPFDPEADDYRIANALWLAEASRIVYRHDVEEDPEPPTPTRTNLLARAGFRTLRFARSEETGTEAIVLEGTVPSPFAVLAFRGTEQSVKDLVSDLAVAKSPAGDDDAAVHEGFLRALESVWPALEETLSALTCPVFFTGHSLGAALATLAAARRPPRALYTFGSPRVGNAAFARSLATVHHHRVVDDQDVVATVPPEWLGYVHTGDERRLTEPASPFGALRSLRRLVRLEPPKPLADHAPVNYVDRLRPLAP